jgi:K+-sensing histidine kinase KdpD
LDGDDPVEAIVEFARSRGITQLFIGHSQRTGIWPRLWGSPVDKLIVRVRATTRLTDAGVEAIGFLPRLQVSVRGCCG